VFDSYSHVDAAVAERVLSIRPEQPADHEAVFRVTEFAFGQPAEANLVEALRGSPAFIPELSLVAVEGERIVGHILFTRVTLRSDTTTPAALALAPMAVLPVCQRRGIGSALVKRGLADARHLGHDLAGC